MTARRAWADVDLDAVAANAEALRRLVAPAALCAVVKANGYGHGAAECARAARAGGATWLAVALVEEGIALREAGVEGPVLVLSEPAPAAMPAVVAAGLTPTLYTAAGAEAASVAASAAKVELAAHVKIDTGMHRVGAPPAEGAALARTVAASADLRLEGLWTHLAAAEDPAHDAYTERQLDIFDACVEGLEAGGVRPELLHAANSGAALAHPRARYDLVRCGIAVYGYPPGPAVDGVVELQPALSLRAEVSFVKEVAAGERLSYGLRYELAEPSIVATVPLGYADGVPRRLSSVGAEVLIRGRRRPIAGTVTMDQILVDCGPVADPSSSVSVGDEVVLLGAQGGERVTAEDWAGPLETISYEIVCGIGPRVPRRYGGRTA